MTKCRKVGDTKAVQLKLWRALLRVEKISESEEVSPETRLKAIHCIIQLSGQYVGITEQVKKDRMDLDFYG